MVNKINPPQVPEVFKEFAQRVALAAEQLGIKSFTMHAEPDWKEEDGRVAVYPNKNRIVVSYFRYENSTGSGENLVVKMELDVERVVYQTKSLPPTATGSLS